jgi:hypothetical protein
MVRAAPTNIERLDALASAPASDLRVADRPSVFAKEQVLTSDFPAATYSCAELIGSLELRGRAGKAQRRDLPASWCGLYPAAGNVPW